MALDPVSIHQRDQSKELTCDLRVISVLRWADDSYADRHLTLKQFSSRLGISEKYLGLLSKRQTGTTFHLYLNRLRVNKATKKLLENPYQSIKEVALTTGYSAQTNFDRAFKSVYGVSPKQFRQRVWKEAKWGKSEDEITSLPAEETRRAEGTPVVLAASNRKVTTYLLPTSEGQKHFERGVACGEIAESLGE